MNEETKPAHDARSDLLKLTATIVAAQVRATLLDPSDLAGLIRSVYQALTQASVAEVQASELVPAVPIRKSVFPDYVICLEDGKKLKMLKRYIHARYSLSPEGYRRKWGLPPNYPMVAPNYAAACSKMAKHRSLARSTEPPVDGQAKEPPAKMIDGRPVTRGPPRRARGHKG